MYRIDSGAPGWFSLWRACLAPGASHRSPSQGWDSPGTSLRPTGNAGLCSAIQAYETIIEPELKKRANEYLRTIQDRVKKAGVDAVTFSLLVGPIAETIEKELAACKADLVVMTTHGRGPLSRFWLGSVADQLVRQSTVPVLLLRPGEGAADLQQDELPRKSTHSPGLARHWPSRSFQLRWPSAACWMPSAPCCGSCPGWVRSEPMRTGKPCRSRPAWLERLKELHEQETQQAKGYLEQVARTHPTARLTSRVISAEQPAGAIVQQAGPGNSSVIALATHGRHGLPRLFLGSVADKVIRARQWTCARLPAAEPVKPITRGVP